MLGAKGVSRSVAALIAARSNPLRLGACTLSLVAPEGRWEARRRIDAAGPGPLAVKLAADVPGGEEELDRRLSHGVGIRLLPWGARD